MPDIEKTHPSLRNKILVNMQKNCPVYWLHNKEQDNLFSGVCIIQTDDIVQYTIDKQVLRDIIIIELGNLKERKQMGIWTFKKFTSNELSVIVRICVALGDDMRDWIINKIKELGLDDE